MRKCTPLIIIILAALNLSSCGYLDFPNWKQYRNDEYGFLVLFPRNWEEQEDVLDTVVLVTAPLEKNAIFTANANVTVTELPAEIPLQTYFDAQKEELRFFPQKLYDMTEGQVQTGIQRGIWLAYTSEVTPDFPIRTINCLWINKKRVFVITGSCASNKFPKYEPIFLKIFKSMRIK
jgi:hypothetical protein